MILSAAPIIHARTCNVDFRSGDLLVVPSFFQPEDVRWARKYILGSTRYFELAGKAGRRVIFSREDVVVSGLSIRIGDLYQLCGKEPRYHLVDGTRTNYAFIGYVFPRGSLEKPFDIPYSMYLSLFETYMGLRWEDSGNDPNSFVSTKVPCTPVDFPEAETVSDILDLSKALPYAIDTNADTPERLCAQALMLAARQPGFGFCTDVPMAKSVIDSSFRIVTSGKAGSINAALQSQAASTAQRDPAKNPAPSGREQSDKKALLFKCILGVLAAVCLFAILFVLTKK